MRRMLTVCAVITVALVGVALGVTAASAPGAGQPLYLNAHASIGSRVNVLLLPRMTLAEKVGQMDQIVVGRLRDTSRPGQRRLQRRQQRPAAAEPASSNVLDHERHRLDPVRRHRQPDRQHRPRLGGARTTRSSTTRSSTRACTSRSSTASTPCTASATRPTRRCSRSRSAWARPGTRRWREAGGAVTRAQLQATGTTLGLRARSRTSPRDNRWGRYYETWAEQPALAAAMGAANIARHAGRRRRPLRSRPRSSTSPATRSRSTATTGSRPQLPIRYLQDIFLPSYAAAIDAGAATVMVNSGSINDIPATARTSCSPRSCASGSASRAW